MQDWLYQLQNWAFQIQIMNQYRKLVEQDKVIENLRESLRSVLRITVPKFSHPCLVSTPNSP